MGAAASLGSMNENAGPVLDRRALERLYRKYNDRRYISTDPLQYVYRYEHQRDREVAALIAASLAFGNVAQIRRSVERILDSMGRGPAEYVLSASPRKLRNDFRLFRHRWISGDDMASLLTGVARAMREYDSLGKLFYAKLEAADRDVIPAATKFAEDIFSRSGGFNTCLLPSPRSRSACKKLNLFLRWMVRSDEVDPGGWTGVSPAMLIVPVDVHMHRISRRLGLTNRRSADLATAQEITEGFKAVAPEDPVKYDFALTRLGMLRDGDDTERDREQLYC
jgi:uncharacterized protein (TIGR02757 family)